MLSKFGEDDRVPRDKLWRVRQKFGVSNDGHLLMAIMSLYCQPEVSVCVNGKQLKSFHMDAGLRHRVVNGLIRSDSNPA